GAAGYTMDVHVDGIPGQDGGGNYSVKSFSWGEHGRVFPRGVAGELTFIHTVDNSTVALLQAVASHREVKNAELPVRLAAAPNTVIMTIRMNDVRVQSVCESGATTATDAKPDESVTLRFERVEYTFQPTGPDGRPLGAPVKFSSGFTDHDHDGDH